MYWPKFMEEYQAVCDWLQIKNVVNAHPVVMAILSEIICGADTVHAALKRVQPAFDEDDISEKAYQAISRWQCCLPRDAAILGEIYQRTSQGRKTRGVYYTPPEIVEFILQHTIAKHSVLENPFVKILDPACGCGYFLLAAYDLLRQKYQAAKTLLEAAYPNKDWSDAGIHRHIIQYNLWGADIDPVAINIARVGLFLKQPQVVEVQPNLLVCDSLAPRDDIAAVQESRQFWSGPYDFVIGNPPYLSFGLRGMSRLDPDYADYLRRAYKETAEYKLSYYVLFMQRGLDLLADGGKLGFIVPDSFLLGRYFSKIRRYILETAAIEAITHVTGPIFKQVTLGTSAICVLRKEAEISRRMWQPVHIYQCHVPLDLREEKPVCQLKQQYYFFTAHNRFRLFFDLTAKNLIDRIEEKGVPLENFSSGHTGVRSLTKQSEIIASECRGAGWRPGLISGRQIHRYSVDYQGHWLHIEPSKLYKGGWKDEIVSQRKILLRQTGYTLVAAIDDQGLYHLNNIHSFTLTNSSVGLDYLLLLLNSRLMSFYYHVTSMEYGRAMAQTDIETIELLPVRLHSELDRQAAILAQGMTDLLRRGHTGDKEARRKAFALDDYINQLIYRIYELSEQDVAYIEAYEGKRQAAMMQKNKDKI